MYYYTYILQIYLIIWLLDYLVNMHLIPSIILICIQDSFMKVVNPNFQHSWLLYNTFHTIQNFIPDIMYIYSKKKKSDKKKCIPDNKKKTDIAKKFFFWITSAISIMFLYLVKSHLNTKIKPHLNKLRWNMTVDKMLGIFEESYKYIIKKKQNEVQYIVTKVCEYMKIRNDLRKNNQRWM